MIEFRKNFWRKSFITLALVLLFFNSVLIVRSIDVHQAKSWKKICSHVLEMEDEQRSVYIKQHAEQLNKVQENYFASVISIPDHDYSNDGQIAEQNYDQAQLELITDDLFTETGQFNVLNEQLNSNEKYSDFIANTQLDFADTFAVFQTDDPYLKKVEQKTATAYLPFQNRELELTNWRSFEQADNWRIGELFICLLIIFQAYNLFYNEKNSGFLFLLYPLPKGRSYLMRTKMSVLALTSLTICFVFALNSYFVFEMYYGTFDLSVPIQAIPSYQRSVLDITLGDLILIQIMVRSLAVFLLAQIVLFISQLVRRISGLFISLAILLIFKFTLYTYSLSFGIFSILRYTNLIFFLNVRELFQTEYFINVFGNPVSARLFISVVLPLGVVFMFILNQTWFDKFIPVKPVKSGTGIRSAKISTSLIKHEIYKLFISSRGVIILLVFTVLQIYLSINSPIDFLTKEQFYRQYMKKLEGEITDDKLQFIADERLKFDELRNELKLFNELYEQGNISSTEFNFKTGEISSQLSTEPAFIQVENNLFHLQQLEPENRIFVYDSGFNRLAGLSEQGESDDILNSTILVFCIIMLLSEYATKDYQIKLNQITDAYKYGRERHLKTRLQTGLLGSSIAYMVIYVPHLIKITSAFGIQGLFCNIEHLPRWQQFLSAGYFNKMPIIIYFSLLYLGRLFLVWFLAIAIQILAILQRKIQRVIGTALFVFNISLFISLLGFRIIDKYSLNNIFYGNPLYQKAPFLILVIPLWILVLISASFYYCLKLVDTTSNK
ncbi:hypothetical protein [Globicatella sulfidifaciens]|uniref:Uncharacterized protein n=1 Tax=Globicatella sulfidifaciens TaxID=136093 RepID=A0A7X8C5G7_9LACT|nr:hypothetical protein [Globicatella sulfidifaciens]NLJ19337.1 hypothetical protein [Globicatella sulfidifaciens]